MSRSPVLLTFEGPVASLLFDRADAGNTITRQLIEDCHDALDRVLASGSPVLVLRGSPEVFCSGADFAEISAGPPSDGREADRLYDLWARLGEVPFVTIAQVDGRAIAGGLGFVAACDVALAGDRASFTLSELLFGICPACVLPFVARRIGWQRARYLTLTTGSISAATASAWGLVDECGPSAAELVSRRLVRLRRLSPDVIARVKTYTAHLSGSVRQWQADAVACNRDTFADDGVRQRLAAFVAGGALPWASRSRNA